MRYADSCCSYTETHEPHQYIFTGPCIDCKTPQTVIVPASELYSYRTGHLIQLAMPSVSDDDREFLISGICPFCWENRFYDGYEDHEDDGCDMPTVDYNGDGLDGTEECDGCSQPHIDCECEELDFRDESEGLSSGDMN